MTSINSEAENEFINNLAGPRPVTDIGRFWIGGHKLGGSCVKAHWSNSYITALSLVESCRVLKYFHPLKSSIIGGSCVNSCWRWSDKSSWTNYTNWRKTRPDKHKFDPPRSCLIMLQTADWFDVACDFPRYFVCKKPVPAPVQAPDWSTQS